MCEKADFCHYYIQICLAYSCSQPLKAQFKNNGLYTQSVAVHDDETSFFFFFFLCICFNNNSPLSPQQSMSRLPVMSSKRVLAENAQDLAPAQVCVNPSVYLFTATV